MNQLLKIGSISAAAILLASVNANATLVDILGTLGQAANYTVFSLTGTDQNLSNVTINGDSAVGPNGQVEVMAPSTINGTLYVDPTATVSGPGNVTGGTQIANLQQAVTDAINASNSFAGMAATQMFSSLSAATTITGNGGNNIIDITGGINLNNANITLSGSANDRFILNITGSMSLTGTASVVLTGGLTTSDVVLNFTGSGTSINTHVGDVINGIVLAPQTSMTLDGIFNGKLIGGGSILKLMSGATVNGITVVPEVTPSWVIFGFLGLVVAFSARRALMGRVCAVATRRKTRIG
jgi:hypothetical protein